MLKVSDIHHAYNKQEPVFRGLSLDLGVGVVGLFGKNGAGKTTLLKLLAGLMKAQEGSVEVMGYTPMQRNPAFLEQIYFVPEEFFLPAVKIRDYVRAQVPFYPSFDIESFDKVMDAFDMDMGKSLDKLSYGQKKKFLIAFALACKCPFILLDEPTNGLDIPSKTIFRRVMASEVSENQLVVVSTHQARDIENLIDEILILDKGRLMLKESLQSIENKISCMTKPDPENALYSEPVPGGYKCLVPAEDSVYPVDIELLFNAVTSGIKLFEYED